MSRGHAAGLRVALASCALAGCAEDRAAEPDAFELSEVVDARRAQLAGALAPVALPDLDPDLVEEVEGMVTMLANADGRMREVPRATIRDDVGAAAIPRLAAALAATERPPEERVAAAELLATLDHPAAAEALMTQLESAPEAWVRRWCAWHLASIDQDRHVPRLLLRLKYEADHETVIWLARCLARHANYAGVDVLARLASSEQVGAQAAEQLSAIAGEVGVEPDELRRLWSSIEAESLPQPAPSDALRAAVWQLVDELSSEHFQLRGVDDARYVLSHMGPWVALEIAPALADADDHVRLHTSQVLERMGARAHAAGPALLRALAEPGLAPAAAEALGRVGYPRAIPALAARSAADQPHELRVGAVGALGRIGLAEGLAPVRACFADGEPHDLRMTAATALVLLDAGDEAVEWLVGELPESDEAEIALETWLVRGTEERRNGFLDALDAWRSRAGPPGVIPTLEMVADRRRSRAKELGDRASGLLGSR